jgi:hypothetical protein
MSRRCHQFRDLGHDIGVLGPKNRNAPKNAEPADCSGHLLNDFHLLRKSNAPSTASAARVFPQRGTKGCQ